MARRTSAYDVVLVDPQDGEVISPPGAGAEFRNLSRRLSPNGCLVMHLRSDADRNAVHAEVALGLPDAQLVQVPLQNSTDLLLYGLRQPMLQSVPEGMESAARRLQRALQLDFPDYLYRINEGARVLSLRPGSKSG